MLKTLFLTQLSMYFFFFFFFNDTATTEIYTLSLHDALPIWTKLRGGVLPGFGNTTPTDAFKAGDFRDRKSTRLNSSHLVISYAVFCLKKKKIHYVELPILHLQDQFTLATVSHLLAYLHVSVL